MAKPLVAALIVLCSCTVAKAEGERYDGSWWSAAPGDTREQREVKVADHAVFAAFAFPGQLDGPADTPCLKYCCTASAELGVMLLGSKKSPEALRALVALLRLRVDGSLAEDHSCFVLSKGKRILPYLRALDPTQLAKRCNEEWTAVRRSDATRPARDVERVCAPAADIAARRKELLDAATKGRRCPPEDF